MDEDSRQIKGKISMLAAVSWIADHSIEHTKHRTKFYLGQNI